MVVEKPWNAHRIFFKIKACMNPAFSKTKKQTNHDAFVCVLQGVPRQPDLPVPHPSVGSHIAQCHSVWHAGACGGLLCHQETYSQPLPQAAERTVSVLVRSPSVHC